MTRPLQQPLDQPRVGPLQILLDHAQQDKAAPQIDILTQIQALPRNAQLLHAQLDGRARLARHVTPDLPLGADLEPGRRVDVRLQTPRQVVEAAVVGDAAGQQAAGEVGDAVGDLVPGGVSLELVGQGQGRRRVAAAVAGDERVQRDHLAVGVEDVDDEVAGDMGGEGGDVREDGAFEHGESADSIMLTERNKYM